MPTRLFHISDVHFGAEDRNALDAVKSAIAAERPAALVCTGDITQRAKISEYEAAREWFADIDIPVLLDPGNHDMPYVNMLERLLDPYRRFNRLRSQVADHGFESDDCVLIPLKTTVRAQWRFPWVDGVVTRSALAETLRQLEELEKDKRQKIVTGHHPLLGPQSKTRNPTIWGDRAFAKLARAGAHAVLSGHIHVPYDRLRMVSRRSMRMIGAGTLSTRLRGGAAPSYQVIECTPASIETELRTLD